MTQLLEILPGVLFFIAYWKYGFFVATWVLMAATTIQVSILKLLRKPISGAVKFTFYAALAFGVLTLLFRNPLFVQWKSTVVPWSIALALLVSQYVGKRNVLERTLGKQVSFTHATWQKLAWLWIGGLSMSGGLNLIVIYGFSEEFWVTYRLVFGFTFSTLMLVLSILLLHRMGELQKIVRHLQRDEHNPSATESRDAR